MKIILYIFLGILTTAPTWSLEADEAQERRTRGGLRLFRAILAADEDISSKTNPNGSLLLTVLYHENSRMAETFAEELRILGKGSKRGKIRKVPIEVEISNDLSLDSYADRVPAGFFIVEDLRDSDLDHLVRYGIDRGVIVYSPFEGDVDRGVLGGLAIETRVRPYINLKTMRDSRIRIKAFFLKVAKHYDP